MSYLLREGDLRAPLAPSLAVLSALAHCDLSSVWIVQRIVTCALRLADAIDASRDGDDAAQWTQQLVALARRVARECSSVLRLDNALVDALETAAASRAMSTKAHVALLLLDKQPRQSSVDRECRSVQTLFQLASKPQPPTAAAPTNTDVASRRSDWHSLLDTAPTSLHHVRTVRNVVRSAIDVSEVHGQRVMVSLCLVLSTAARASPLYCYCGCDDQQLCRRTASRRTRARAQAAAQ